MELFYVKQTRAAVACIGIRYKQFHTLNAKSVTVFIASLLGDEMVRQKYVNQPTFSEHQRVLKR